VPRLQIPELCFADAPAGVRGQEFVSSFPSGIHLGATFDRDLMLKYGQALGKEYRGKGIHVALGPFIGPIGRVVRGGRNWEGLGADPYLAGAGGALITRGTQEQGVIATPKVSEGPGYIEVETHTQNSTGLHRSKSTDAALVVKVRLCRQTWMIAPCTNSMLGHLWTLCARERLR
jgi:beta-glucosidase-like glycosyl hydrolase